MRRAHTDLLTGVQSVSSGPAYAYPGAARRCLGEAESLPSGRQDRPQHPLRRCSSVATSSRSRDGHARRHGVTRTRTAHRSRPGSRRPDRSGAIRGVRCLGGKRNHASAAADDHARRPHRLHESVESRTRRPLIPTVSIGDGGLCSCVQSFPFTGEMVPGPWRSLTWKDVCAARRRQLQADRRRQDDSARDRRALLPADLPERVRRDFTPVWARVPRWRPTTPPTGQYSTILSVTDPKANLAIDPNMQAP